MNLPPLPAGYHPPARRLELKALSAPLAFPRLMGWCGHGPAPIHGVTRALECRSQYFETKRRETMEYPEGATEARLSGSLGELPLVVLTREHSLRTPRYSLRPIFTGAPCRIW